MNTLFSVRYKPWEGIGLRVENAPNSEEALRLAGLDWEVVQEPIYTESDIPVEGYKANIRDDDGSVLGIVTDRYKVVQNKEAFAFIDEMLGYGVTYQAAGSFDNGRKVWMLAKLPNEYIMDGERVSPYLVFYNSHDGSGSIRIAVTPIRILCNNMLNLSLKSAGRSFSMIHTGDIETKMEEAKEILFNAEHYMDELGKEIIELKKKELTDDQVKEFINELIPLEEDASVQQTRNVRKLRNDIERRYFDAPDLSHVGKNAYRFINAVADFATHAEPLRKTNGYREKMFARSVEGHPLLDKAYDMVMAA